MHPNPSELQQTLSDAQSLEWGSSQQLQLLERLRASCPAFVPGLLISSRAMLWGKEDVQDSAAFFDEVEQILRHALDASGRQTASLLGMARFMTVVRDSPQAAELLYREAAARALEALEEAWAGLIETLGESEKKDEAARIFAMARQVFPRSEQLSDAAKYAKVED